MEFSQKGKDLLKECEGEALFPYDDQTGKPTKVWCKGATISVGYLISEQEWPLYKDGISQQQSEVLYSKTLVRFVNCVNDVVRSKLTQSQFDSLVIFCYNIGIGAFSKSSVVKMINGQQTNYKTLDDAWLAWNKSQGKVMKGLDNRRKTELQLWHTGIYKRIS